jgi:hypothetical protein
MEIPETKGVIDLIAYSPNDRYLIGVCNSENMLIIW